MDNFTWNEMRITEALSRYLVNKHRPFLEHCKLWGSIMDVGSIIPHLMHVSDFEVKTTFQDFVKDFEKEKHELMGGYNESSSHPGFANYFWFVCPNGVIPELAIPPYAGLKYACVDECGQIWITTIKKAPRLHSFELQPREMYKMFARASRRRVAGSQLGRHIEFDGQDIRYRKIQQEITNRKVNG
jgi:hypothetical protein